MLPVTIFSQGIDREKRFVKKVAFVPARSGSKRVPNKNIRPLQGHPMISYTIRAALDSGVFDAVICATDSEEYRDIALHYGAEVPFLRPAEISGDKSPDIDWVVWMLRALFQIRNKTVHEAWLADLSHYPMFSRLYDAVCVVAAGASSMRLGEEWRNDGKLVLHLAAQPSAPTGVVVETVRRLRGDSCKWNGGLG